MTETSNRSLDPEQGAKQVSEATPATSSMESLTTTLGMKDTLGAALCKQDKYDDAASLLREVLTTREALGQSKTDDDMLRTMNNLGAALKGQGHLAEAEALHRHVLEADQEILRSQHISVIISMNNLADVLARQGKFEEAEKLQRQAVELSKEVRGAENPDTLGVMENLAKILTRQDNNEQAEKMKQKVMELRQSAQRDHHPETASSTSNAASVPSRPEESHEPEIEPEIRQTNLEIITNMDNRVGVLMDQGSYDEAESLLQKVVKLSAEMFGTENESTRSRKRRLAVVLIDNGKPDQSEDILRDLLVTESA